MFILSPMGFGMFVEQHRYTLISMGIIIVVVLLTHRGEGSNDLVIRHGADFARHHC